MLVGVFIGTIGVEIVLGGGRDQEQDDPESPLWAILVEVMDMGGVSRVAGWI